jgi:hypothetical protein
MGFSSAPRRLARGAQWARFVTKPGIAARRGDDPAPAIVGPRSARYFISTTI